MLRELVLALLAVSEHALPVGPEELFVAQPWIEGVACDDSAERWVLYGPACGARMWTSGDHESPTLIAAGNVETVRFGRDGDSILLWRSADGARSLLVYSIAEGRVVRTVAGLRGERASCFLGSSGVVLESYRDGSMLVDYRTGERTRLTLIDARFDPDGTRVWTQAMGKAHLLEWPSRRELASWEGSRPEFSQDGRFAAITSGPARVLDAQTGAVLFESTAAARSTAFYGSGRIFAALDFGQTLEWVDLDEDPLVRRSVTFSVKPQRVVNFPGTALLFVQLPDQVEQVVDLDADARTLWIRTTSNEKYFRREPITVDPKGRWILCRRGSSGALAFVDARTGEETPFPGLGGTAPWIRDLASDGRNLFVLFQDELLRLSPTGSVPEVVVTSDEDPQAVEVDCGRKLLCLRGKDEYQVFDAESLERLARWPSDEAAYVHFAAKREAALVFGDEGWFVHDFERGGRVRAGAGPYVGGAISDEGDRICLVATDGPARVEVSPGRWRDVHVQAKSGLADWSGSHVAIHTGEYTFGTQAKIVLVDVDADEDPVELVADDGWLSVGEPRFSPDGKRLLAGCSLMESESLFCWDVATGRQLWSRDHGVCYGGVDVGWSSSGDRAFFRCARPLVIEAKTGRTLLALGGRFKVFDFKSSVHHMALLDDGSTVLAVDGGLTVLDARGAVRYRWWRFAPGSTLLVDGRKKTYCATGDAARWVHARLSDTEVVPLLDLEDRR